MLIDRGRGPALILIPGIQGRCEWMRPAIDALSARYRVLSFSLDDVPRDAFFDRAVEHIDDILDRTRAATAVIAGVSFGGLLALRYAARRPARTGRLVLVSTPSPHMRLDPITARYTRRPTLSLPLFALRGAGRLWPELVAGLPTWPVRLRFAVRHGARVLRYPMAPRHMADWVEAWMAADLVSDCRAVAAPTRVITGDARLDLVVPVASSIEYLQLIPGARHVVFPRTGHMGLLMRPDDFAALVAGSS